MRKIVCFVSILLLAIFISLSSAQKKSLQGPRIFLSEKEWDFGYVPQGSAVSHFFLVKNIGDDTLQILHVRPGCACTYAPLKKDLLAPQDSTLLEVIFNSKNYQGPKTLGVVIYSNDTANIIDISFSVNIENEFPLVKIEPLQVKFDSLKIEKMTPKKLTLFNKSNSPLLIAIVERPKDYIDFQLSKQSLDPQEKGELILQINPKTAPGPFRTNLTLDFLNKSSGQGSERIRYTLPISGTILPR